MFRSPLLAFILLSSPALANSPTDKIHPLIGTSNDGQTFPGAATPWGMVSPSPHTTYTSPLDYVMGGLISTSGYIYGQPQIEGFGQTHLSGTGCPALGAPLVLVDRGHHKFTDLKSPYHTEKAQAGYYSVVLDRFKTRVEVTATPRVGVHRFTFSGNKPAHVLVNAYRNLSWAQKQGHVKFVSDTEVVGWSKIGNFCNQGDQETLYFAAKVSRVPDAHGTWEGLGIIDLDKLQRTGEVGAWFTYNNPETVELYIGVSYTSMENARSNLHAETDGQDFTSLAAKAVDAWKQQLAKIEVKGGKTEDQVMFYTALYHALLHPNVISDVNGDYPYFGKEGHGNNTTRPRYSVFSLWDIYRNLNTLLGWLYPQREQEILLTLEDMVYESGHSPKWELIGHEVNMMVGDPALSIFAEGYLNGFKFQDVHRLFRTLYAGATADRDDGPRPGNKVYRDLGYIPQKTKGVWGSVSTTLEYSYHDWALAQMAQRLGYTQEHDVLMQQSNGWEILYDESTGTFRPKHANGKFLTAFDPTQGTGEAMFHLGGPGFVEGNAYQYAYMLPHGIDRLIELHGGSDAFVEDLQKVFTKQQFIMWNEPDFNYPYLFGLVKGQEGIAQKLVAETRAKFFSNTPGGLPGNDDCGVMSAWYIFSALGRNPVNPVAGTYVSVPPLFPEIRIKNETEE